MAQLTVRQVTDRVVRELKQRAAANGRSAEAEHREILRRALLGNSEDFATRAAATAGAARIHGGQHGGHPRGPRSGLPRMTRFVVDASVAVKWLVREPLSHQASLLLARDVSLMAPEPAVRRGGKRTVGDEAARRSGG